MIDWKDLTEKGSIYLKKKRIVFSLIKHNKNTFDGLNHVGRGNYFRRAGSNPANPTIKKIFFEEMKQKWHVTTTTTNY